MGCLKSAAARESAEHTGRGRGGRPPREKMWPRPLETTCFAGKHNGTPRATRLSAQDSTAHGHTTHMSHAATRTRRSHTAHPWPHAPNMAPAHACALRKNGMPPEPGVRSAPVRTKKARGADGRHHSAVTRSGGSRAPIVQKAAYAPKLRLDSLS